MKPKPVIWSWRIPPDVLKKLDRLKGKEARSQWLNRMIREAGK